MAHKILLVEDDENHRLLVQEELQDRGYSVTTAHNGREGVAEFKKGKFDLVIMDIHMPEMDGLEALGILVEEKIDIPVILYSAYSKYQKTYMSWSADAYVVKSSDLTDLMEKVAELLKKDAI